MNHQKPLPHPPRKNNASDDIDNPTDTDPDMDPLALIAKYNLYGVDENDWGELEGIIKRITESANKDGARFRFFSLIKQGMKNAHGSLMSFLSGKERANIALTLHGKREMYDVLTDTVVPYEGGTDELRISFISSGSSLAVKFGNVFDLTEVERCR